ncbi:MAG: phosphotransferase, partial [Betaproteobacteria bacterium]
RAGLATPDARIAWTPLSGGVSSDIWRVDTGGRTFCIKCALPRLKTEQPWHAPVGRNAYEWAWINFATRHCPDNVPKPIAHDPGQGIFAMEFLDPTLYPNWKRLLLDGHIDPSVAAAMGTLVARLHAASAGDNAIAAAFPTDAIFDAIRLAPYLIATADRHPDVGGRLRELASRTALTKVALVHGDVSPKNVLVGPGGPVLLDAECAWFGDPAFDVAFCLNHFLLKCAARPARRQALYACFDKFADAYFAGVAWEPRGAIDARVATLLPALSLARVDGKSPVEYLDDDDRRSIRKIVRPLLVDPPACVDAVRTRWQLALPG